MLMNKIKSRIDHNNSTTIIAGHTFRVPTDEDLETIQHRQVIIRYNPNKFSVSVLTCANMAILKHLAFIQLRVQS